MRLDSIFSSSINSIKHNLYIFPGAWHTVVSKKSCYYDTYMLVRGKTDNKQVNK